MDEFGLYYSRLSKEHVLMPSMRSVLKSGYAHFGESAVLRVVKHIRDDSTEWVFRSSVERYFILPKDLIVWKDL